MSFHAVYLCSPASRRPLHACSSRSLLTLPPAENNLLFIETSALDASNVESAFQNILTGESAFRRDLSSTTP